MFNRSSGSHNHIPTQLTIRTLVDRLDPSQLLAMLVIIIGRSKSECTTTTTSSSSSRRSYHKRMGLAEREGRRALSLANDFKSLASYTQNSTQKLHSLYTRITTACSANRQQQQQQQKLPACQPAAPAAVRRWFMRSCFSSSFSSGLASSLACLLARLLLQLPLPSWLYGLGLLDVCARVCVCVHLGRPTVEIGGKSQPQALRRPSKSYQVDPRQVQRRALSTYYTYQHWYFTNYSGRRNRLHLSRPAMQFVTPA